MLSSNMLERLQLARETLHGFSEQELRAYAMRPKGAVSDKYVTIDERLPGLTETERRVLVDDLLQSYNWC